MTVVLTNLQMQVLEKLADYRYLTAQQFLDLGVSKNLNSIRSNVISKLLDRKRPLIERKSFGQELPGEGGRIPNLHCLSKYGASVVANQWQVPEEEIEFPTGGIQVGRDVSHRIATIDCHIRFRKWLEQIDGQATISDWYFDKTGSQRGTGHQEADTRVYSQGLQSRGRKSNWCEPDAIFGAQIGNVSIIYVLEVHCFPDTGRITEQLVNHMQLLLNRAVAKKYRSDRSNLVLSVHEHNSTLKGVRARLQGTQGFERVANDFVFNTLKSVRGNISEGWIYADGTSANPFPV